MSSLSLAVILLSPASLFGFINHRYMRLPTAIGLMVVRLRLDGVVVPTPRRAPQGRCLSDALPLGGGA